MSTLRRYAFALLAVTGLGLAGCSKTVPIGAVISETGAAASYGDKVKKGLDLAEAQINATGGFDGKSFQLLYRDDATNPGVGRQMTTELISKDGVHLVIGAVSSTVTLAIAPICEKQHVILLSPTASAPQISSAGEYIFRNYPSDILEGTAMANFARDLGLERLVIFAADNEYGGGLEDVFAGEFQSRFRKIVQTVEFKEDEAGTLAPEIQKVKALNPDGIYIAAYVRDVAELVKQIREAGLKSVIMTSSSVTAGDMNQMAGPTAEDVIFPQSSTFDPASETPEVRAFVEAYRKRYGEDPDSFAAHGYDALRLLLLAMQKGGSAHPRDVRIGLLAISDYEGAAGRVAFDEHGDIIQYPRLYVIRQGRAIPYDRFKEEGGSLQIPGR
jgi:branched-chain amino acid transport system substrate-binding protein